MSKSKFGYETNRFGSSEVKFNQHNLYGKDELYSKDKLNGRPITAKDGESVTTEEQMKKGIKEYENKIHNTRASILTTLGETEYLENCIGNELNGQSESLMRIDTELDAMDHKLTVSETLVKNFSRWFTFKKVSTISTVVDIESNLKIKTKFEPIKIDEKDFTNNSKHKNEKKMQDREENYLTEEEEKKKKEDDFYDGVFKSLNRLENNAKQYTKILTEHSDAIETISEKVEKSDMRIKKTNEKVKKYG